jgi:hypothetical protein
MFMFTSVRTSDLASIYAVFFVLCYFYFIDSSTVRSEEEKYTGEEKELGDMLEEFLDYKQQSTSTPLRQQHTQPDVSHTKQEMFQDVTEQLERLETTSPSVVTHKQGTCPYRVLPTRCNTTQCIYFCEMLYMFQAGPPPIIRSSKLYTQHQVLVRLYCYLLLSWKRQTSSNPSTTATGGSKA